MKTKPRRLGVDIGKVIIQRDTEEWQPNKPRQEIPNARKVIARLVSEEFGKENVFLISKADALKQIESRAWLLENNFYEDTGINPLHVIFCMHRADKAKICKTLSITHFIDDRLEVLSHLVDIVSHLYLFNPRIEETSKFPQFLPYVCEARTWKNIEELFFD